MTTTSSTFVITIIATITDNKIENAVIEKIEIQPNDGKNYALTGLSGSSTPAYPTAPTQVEKTDIFDYIYADFKDGVGLQRVSIYDTRLLDCFIPCYRMGANVKPAIGAKIIRSSRQVRGYRVSGLALVKCE